MHGQSFIIPTSCAQPVDGSSQQPPLSFGATHKSNLKEKRATAASDAAAIPARDSSEWKSVKRVTNVTSQTKDKLLSEN